MAASIPGEELTRAMSAIPIFDVQSQMHGARLAARGLDDLLRDAALQAELQAASLEQARAALLPDSEEADDLVQWSLPRLSRSRNTLSSWSLRLLLRDLYNWEEPLTAGSWRRLDAIVRERARDPLWPGEVLKRAGIVRACTDLSRRGLGGADGLLQYSVEWGAFFHSPEHGFDAAVYELERTWGRSPEPPVLHPPEKRPPTYRVVRSTEDIRIAAADYVRALPIAETVAVTLRLGNAVPGRTPSDAEMESALARRPTAGIDEGDVYSAYIAEALLEALETRAADLSLLVPVSGSPDGSNRVALASTVSAWAARHPRLRFLCLPGSAELNASLCLQARRLPNVAVAGIPWGATSYGEIGRAFADRLDLLPVGRQCAFTSDAGCVEWAYARCVIARRQWESVLGSRIRIGEFGHDEALALAREAVFDSAREWGRMTTETNQLRG
jgi:hypothetical protein